VAVEICGRFASDSADELLSNPDLKAVFKEAPEKGGVIFAP